MPPLAVALALMLVATPRLSAQTLEGLPATYITAFPDGDVYRVLVFGDWLAEGLAGGLTPAFDDEPGVDIVDKTVSNLGLARNDGETWDIEVGRIAAAERVHGAIVLFGAADRQPIRVDKRRFGIDSAEWKAEYTRRVDLFLKALRKAGAAIYWLGLPVMRQPSAVRDAELMNAIFRERALLNGVKFIDTWSGFADAGGGYSDFGPDLSGKEQRLREGDGVGFTARGQRKLAHFVETELRRDIALARAERDLPLAGGPEEQARVRPGSAVPQASPSLPDAEGGTAAANAIVAALADTPAANATVPITTIVDGKPAVVKVEILRPAIPAAVVAHLQRTASGRSFEIGRTINTDLKGGLTALSSLALASDTGAGRTRVPLTQSPYYKALVKGEALPSKTGRADDFSWPKPWSRPSG